MLSFDFLEKGLGIVSQPNYFAYNFSRKMFLMLYSINWPNFFLFVLTYYIEIIYLPG